MKGIDWLSIVSIVLASVGAILGTINTSYLLFKDKVRLKLQIRAAVFAKGSEILDNHVYCLEVTNLGFVPITLREAGFLLPDGTKRKIPLIFQNAHGVKLPYRLEPRSAASIYASAEETKGIKEHNCKRAFVKTDCGKQFYAKARK